MSTDQTPALARATEEHQRVWHDLADEVSADLAEGSTPLDEAEFNRRVTHATVSAALHDPDGALAAVIDNHDPEVRYWRDGSYKETYCYGCGTTLPAETYGPRHQADAVRAAILGADQ